ncbi:MAG: ABC transporter substrate-binding protein [Oscillospiraceae bacterium]|nr:ABC transporter substrate-binding protein [Oscillospiraceae bacterium]
MKRWIPVLVLLMLCACGHQGETPPAIETPALSWADLAWTQGLDLAYAQQFSVDLAQGGFARITIDQDCYLLVPEGAEPPSDTPEEVVILRRPVHNIYLQATAAMDCFRQLDAMDAVTLSGTQAEGWYLPEARQAMEEGRMIYAGKYSAPDYELIAAQHCGLALESTMIYHTPEVKEQLERLGIPVLVERSSYERHPLGRMEWIKLYGVLLGLEEEADSYFNRQLEQLAPILEQENTGKTVAFFSITSNGSVTVRKPGDYIAKAIDLAGGVYALADLPGEENALSTMNIQMETFYQAARQADILLYNSTIEADLETVDQLIAKSAPLAEFKAVQEGQVWCTGKSMFQSSQSVGALITDLHTVLTQEDPSALTYLYRLT